MVEITTAGRERRIGAGGSTVCRSESFGEAGDLGVDRRDTGVHEQQLQIAGGADRSQQFVFEALAGLGQERDDPFEPVDRPGPQTPDRDARQIAFVVPVGRQQGRGGSRDAGRLAATFTGRRQGLEGGRAGRSELAVEVAQGGDRGGVTGDVGERTRVVGQDLADREVDDRGRNRVAALVVQRRSGHQLGQPIRRDHVDRCHAAVAAERSTRHHSGGVGRNDHGHRRQR